MANDAVAALLFGFGESGMETEKGIGVDRRRE